MVAHRPLRPHLLHRLSDCREASPGDAPYYADLVNRPGSAVDGQVNGAMGAAGATALEPVWVVQDSQAMPHWLPLAVVAAVLAVRVQLKVPGQPMEHFWMSNATDLHQWPVYASCASPPCQPRLASRGSCP